MRYPFEKLKKSRQRFLKGFTDSEALRSFPENNSAIVDEYFRDSLQESRSQWRSHGPQNGLAFVAMGGYGRKELCLHSDIDVLLLFGKKVPSWAGDFVREILFPLWDLGLDLGYGIRTLKECLSVVRDKFEMLTATIDARFICGDYSIYLDLMEKFHRNIIAKKSRALARWLAEQDGSRLEHFGDSSHLLEPNLKEGIGGLRDYHHMLWLARALSGFREPHESLFLGHLSHNEYEQLRERRAFLLLVRNYLHHCSGRKNDRLEFQYQETIARKLGFEDEGTFLAVEEFLSQLHATFTAIKSLSRSFLTTRLPKNRTASKKRAAVNIAPGLILDDGAITFRSGGDILSSPWLLMAIFEHSARLGYPLTLEAKRLVREFLYLVDDAFRGSNETVEVFLKIIKETKFAFEALDQMMEVGFLAVFIPEFERVKDRVEFDAYHIFPVGIHSLQTVRHLKGLDRAKDVLLQDLYLELSCPEQLLLAGLFHDVGKIGTDHALKGAEVTRSILKRFGLRQEVVENICFLVRHHLLLVETATRRDLNDESVAVQCARIIGSVERLKMLYLLTWADSRATGPKAWNQWIATLVLELFFKVLHILEKGELATPDAARTAEEVISYARQQIGCTWNKEDLEACFQAMSPRYLLNTRPQDIVRHLGMVRELRGRERPGKDRPEYATREEIFVFDAKRDEVSDCWEITFIGYDKPGLFATIAGVLTLNNINILSADIYTWGDGTAVDVFSVGNPLDDLFVQETWTKVQTDLSDALAGRLSLKSRLKEKAAASILTNVKKPSRPPGAVVDNESSDFFTVIEVFADDYVGLLYDVTYTLFERGLDIHIAKIATKVDQVVDVFYVRDLEGQKIEDEATVREIRKALLGQLKSP